MRELRRLRRRVSLARPRRETGAVAVEMALITSFVLAPLLLGMVTAGVSYSHAIGLTNATREGARFGATTAVPTTGPTPYATTWANSVISRVRETQFDDKSVEAGAQTSVCVQLYKIGTGAVLNSTVCSIGTGRDGLASTPDDAPALSMPVPSLDPKVPAATAGTCVVRVVTARRFTVNIALKSLDGVSRRWAVSRYERSTCA